MKKSILGFFLVFILIGSCTKDDEQIVNEIATCENCNFTCVDTNETDVITSDCIDNWNCSFLVTTNATVDLNEREGQADGDKNVFQMIRNTEENSSIADENITRILVFELNESQNSFSVEDSELENMQVHFRRICFCGDVEFKALTSGCLQGEKQSDGTWIIQGNLEVPMSSEDIEVIFDAQFTN